MVTSVNLSQYLSLKSANVKIFITIGSNRSFSGLYSGWTKIDAENRNQVSFQYKMLIVCQTEYAESCSYVVGGGGGGGVGPTFRLEVGAECWEKGAPVNVSVQIGHRGYCFCGDIIFMIISKYVVQFTSCRVFMTLLLPPGE